VARLSADVFASTVQSRAPILRLIRHGVSVRVRDLTLLALWRHAVALRCDPIHSD
jgi:hypothetical protein